MSDYSGQLQSPKRQAPPARRRGGGSLAPDDYTPEYTGGSVGVQLPADYYQAWRNLSDIDDDSMFDRVSYVIPGNVTRTWGADISNTGEGNKVLHGPVTYLSVTIGFDIDANGDNVSFLGAPDNKEAMRVAAHAFTKDLLMAVNGTVKKYNGAMAGAATEGRTPNHTELKTAETIKDANGAATRSQLLVSLKMPDSVISALEHQRKCGCKADIQFDHADSCDKPWPPGSSLKKRQSASPPKNA